MASDVPQPHASSWLGGGSRRPSHDGVIAVPAEQRQRQRRREKPLTATLPYHPFIVGSQRNVAQRKSARISPDGVVGTKDHAVRPGERESRWWLTRQRHDSLERRD